MRTLPRSLLGVLFALGCRPAVPDSEDTDSDADADSDADTDTGDCATYGPENRWWHTCVADLPDVTDPIGWGPGDVLPDLLLKDQFGDDVRLHQFAGRLLIVDVSAVWCVPCQQLAPEIEALQRALDGDVTVITVLAEDVTGAPAVRADAEAWADEFGLTGMVGWDPAGGLDDVEAITHYPSTVLVDPAMRVIETDFERLDPELLARAAQGTLGATEVCDNGSDDNIDFLADCQDPDCPATGYCALGQQHAGTLAPCVTDGTRGVDVWRVTVPGPSARLVADTVDAAHTFEPMIQRARALDDRTTAGTIIGDDELACTFAPSAWQCPDAFLPTGTWDVYVVPGWGTGGDGACADPAEARYTLRVYGEGATAALLDGAATSATVALYGLGQ